MNKRFSTLLAAALVAGGVSASATAPTLGELLQVGNKGYVTLGCGATGQYLSIKDDGDFDFTKSNFTQLSDVESAFQGMWQMTINESETADGVPTFTFVNKATGLPFAVQLVTDNNGQSTKAAVYADGGETVWGYEATLGLYHMTEDSVFYFSENKLCAVKGKLVDALKETATDPIIPTQIAKMNFDITPAIFNYLVGKEGKLHFNGGKDVSTGNTNILTAKAWKASSAVSGSGNDDATSFLLSSTKDSSDVKTPQYLVVDTTFYGLSEASALNKLAIDSIRGLAYGAGGKLTYTEPITTYETIEDEDGNVTLKPRFPLGSATFTGKYYLPQDSVALYAANMVTVADAGGVVPESYELSGQSYPSLDGLKTAAKGVVTNAENTILETITEATNGTIWGKAVAVSGSVGNYTVTIDGTPTAGLVDLPAIKGQVKTSVTSPIVSTLNSEIESWNAEQDNSAENATAGINISATYTAESETPVRREITTTASTPGDGLIALKYLTDKTIVLTPNFLVADMDDEDAAKEADFILPLIQSGFTATATGNDYSSEKDGLYVIANGKGQYLAAPIYNTTNGATSAAKWVTVNADLQEVKHMPAYQWVVLKDKNYSEKAKETSSVTIANREFTNLSNSVQLKKNAGAANSYVSAAALGMATTDSLKFVQIEDLAILSDTLLGYKNFEEDSLLVNRYTFNYLHQYADGKYIVKSANDSLAKATDGIQAFKVEKVKDIYDYGFKVTKDVAERIAGLKQLRRQAYQIYIPTVKGDLYLCENAEHQYMFTAKANGTPATLLFKEENDLTDNKHYHALLAVTQSNEEKWGALATETYTKVGVSDETVILKDQKMDETRTSTFFIGKYDAPLYRRFNSLALEGNEGDAADTLRFVEKYRNEYLQIEANPNFTVKGIDFLGIYTPDFTKDGKSFIVDTAWVNRGQGEIKPQYLISIDREDQKFEAGERCPVCQALIDAGKEPVKDCPHDKAGVSPFHLGKYMVNFADSVKTNEDYAWKGYTRAGFVKAAHMGDSLYILTGQFADMTVATFDTAKIHQAVKDKKYDKKYVVDLTGDKHKLVTWSMRFVNPEAAANEEEDDRAFLMESMAKDPKDVIAPINGQWLKMQNGCIVLSGSLNGSTSSFDQITNADDALIFNVEKGNADDFATDNETIATSEVAVIAGEGQVTIAGAAGKKVVITNILGQVVANTVITSDNATIAAPQGVVVVAVEGEEAVKAIVK